jgi:acyl-CoA thioester hydrolase
MSYPRRTFMPLTHTRPFRVRHYECDAYGHLNNAQYLRYMQETAFDASEEAGYDMEYYERRGQHWLIRNTEIEYLSALHYNDLIQVKTWVADFRRSTSRRMYEFHRDEELVARAYTDWVYLDQVIGRPARIPAEMIQAFLPEGTPNPAIQRQPFPAPPPAPAGVFHTRRQVEFRDLDPVQHVNNAVYLDYVSECGFQVVSHFNWPLERMLEAGFGIFLRRNRIEYLLPAFLGEELEITTWAYNLRRSTATRYYAIRRISDEALLARVSTEAVWVDIKSGRIQRIPQDFLEDLRPNLVFPDRPQDLHLSK